jgi:cellulose synthase/poly-beta-1,6-N-acetylglucosamine synthase-like glycosyltransferase
MILLIASLIVFLCYTALIAIYKREWDKLKEFQISNKTSVPVSVVIAARNEEENIITLLHALDNQSYPKESFEVILVNDYSSDKTLEIAKTSSLQNLIVLDMPGDESTSSKKKAIAHGIKSATGDLLITTDADCIPPPRWIETIAQFHTIKEASFIAAPVSYTSNNSLFQIFQALDFLTLQGITAASVSGGLHTMCNGANLAYERNAFLKVNGFEGIDQVASGDDMLLMYKIRQAFPGKIFYLKNKGAIVCTAPMPTWRKFLDQRIRWASKTGYYQDKKVFWSLMLVYLCNLFFPILIVAGFWDHLYWNMALIFLFGKTIVEFAFVYDVALFYGKQNLMGYFFIFQPLHILYTVLIGVVSQSGKYEWKGRRTK